MELQIQDLVATIKHDGIEEANKQAKAIVDKANETAAAIVAEAQAKAKALLDEANSSLDLLKKNAKVSIEQAQRDAVLSFKKSIEAKFKTILASEIRKGFDGNSLSALVKAALSGEDVSKYSVELANVSDSLKAGLSEEIKNGLEIKVSKSVPYGFRLSAKDASSYFDCTDEEIAEMLKPFLGDLKI